MVKVSASFEYSGLSDYWRGNGQRWNDNAACVFAYYGATTTLREIVDQLIADDSDMDGKEAFYDLEDADIEAAILDCLTAEGRRAYEAGEISEFAREYGQ